MSSEPVPNPSSTSTSQPSNSNNPGSKPSYTYYHAGPLFTLADLHTNTLLSNAIHNLSLNSREPNHPTFLPLVPQNIEAREATPHSIRDQDIHSLLSSDLALFTFDGSELDSGTVVEFCIAKFADIPAVILRTDFRGAGDQGHGKDGGGDPWNLMCSNWPRTKGVVVDSMGGYKAGLARAQGRTGEGEGAGNVTAESRGVENVRSLDSDGRTPLTAGELLLQATAEKVVEAMVEVLQVPSVMPKADREAIYRWIAVMPAFKGMGSDGDVQGMLEILRGKEAKGLL